MSNTVGSTPVRLDARDKAMGVAMYAGDYTMPDMLHVVLVRSKYAHAKLISVEIPVLTEGVFCFTAKDIPSNLLPSIKCDQPVLAFDHIRYEGEPVAIVAAPDKNTAIDFARKVELVVEELPIVEDMVKAVSEDAPKIFENGNICGEMHTERGDKNENETALILEENWDMPVQCHGFLEPEAAFTYYEDGILHLISSTQNAFADRDMICSVLGLTQEKVSSKAATVGGGFGGKDGNTAQIFPAIVTWKTGKPAKCVFSREENIRYGMKRHPAKIKARAGFDKEGRFTFFEGRMYLDTGAYGILGPAVLGLGLEHMTGPYEIPAVKLDGWLAYTNHAPASAMRGFGAPQGAMGVETLLNRASQKLGISPLEIRKINAIKRGRPLSMGALMEHSVGFNEALKLFENSDFYREMTEHPEESCGYGIAAGMMSSGMGKNVPDTATVRIDKREDGGYTVRVGLVDIGQGSQTALAMIAADALKVPLNDIHIVMADTESTIASGSTAASRSTYVCGNAILGAAEKILKGGTSAEYSFAFPEITGDKGVHSIFGFIMQGVKLRVDRDTGAVTLLDVHNVTEAGHVIHPDMMAGQIFGGIVMSEGYTLSEEIRYRNGHSMEDGFANYIMPTAMDAPALTNENVPYYEESGPFGAKGIAEAATVALAPALYAALKQIVPDAPISSLPIDRATLIHRS